MSHEFTRSAVKPATVVLRNREGSFSVAFTCSAPMLSVQVFGASIRSLSPDLAATRFSSISVQWTNGQQHCSMAEWLGMQANRWSAC